MITLNQSRVVFTERPHGYHLDGKRLSGITSLIHEVLRLGVYPDASEFVRTIAIPRAGEYGTSVHHAIESYDQLGIKVTAHPKSEKFRTDEFDTHWDVSDELESYIRNREGYEPIANEYTVSDNERYASNIDNIWLKNDTQEIWLVDTKTNNLDYYPGGESGLQEYLSWQLSIYAYLFEQQNPDLKVEGLACNWLRKSDSRFWIIERKPDDDVRRLLSVNWIMLDGHIVFDLIDAQMKGFCTTEIAEKPKLQIVPEQVVKAIVAVAKQAEEAKRLLDEMKSRLREAMEQNNITSWDSGLFKATIAKDSTSKTFDTTRFKKEHPDLYKEYCKEQTKKGGFTIKLREKDG